MADTDSSVDILMIEDNANDEALTLHELAKYHLTNRIRVVRDGQEAVAYFFCTGRYASDQLPLAQRSLDWGIRLTGADAGFFLNGPGTILATKGMTADDAQTLQAAVAGAGGRTVIPLGGTPPRRAVLARLHVNDAAIVLLG